VGKHDPGEGFSIRSDWSANSIVPGMADPSQQEQLNERIFLSSQDCPAILTSFPRKVHPMNHQAANSAILFVAEEGEIPAARPIPPVDLSAVDELCRLLARVIVRAAHELRAVPAEGGAA